MNDQPLHLTPEVAERLKKYTRLGEKIYGYFIAAALLAAVWVFQLDKNGVGTLWVIDHSFPLPIWQLLFQLSALTLAMWTRWLTCAIGTVVLVLLFAFRIANILSMDNPTQFGLYIYGTLIAAIIVMAVLVSMFGKLLEYIIFQEMQRRELVIATAAAETSRQVDTLEGTSVPTKEQGA